MWGSCERERERERMRQAKGTKRNRGHGGSREAARGLRGPSRNSRAYCAIGRAESTAPAV